MQVITIRRFDVKLDSNTSPIIAAYTRALRKAGFQVGSTDEGTATLATVGTKRKYESRLESVVKTVSGVSWTKDENTFNEQRLEVETIEAEFLKKYNAFLIGMLNEQGIDSKNVERQNINSKFVLVQELLYRLSAFALDRRQGKQYLEVLTNFIDIIVTEEILVEKPYFSAATNSKFLSLLATEHETWVKDIQSIITIAEMSEKNTRAIASAFESLKHIKVAAQRLLIAYLNPQQTKGFSEQLVEKTLDDTEKEKVHLFSVYTQTEEKPSCALLEQREIVIKHMAESKQSNKITELYGILDENEKIHEFMTKIDLVIKNTGWIFVLSGVANFSELSKRFKEYTEKCVKVFKIDKDDSILHAPAGVELVRHNITRSKNLLDFSRSINNLNDLQNSDLNSNIRLQITGGMTALVSMQSQLRIECPFVNQNRLLEFNGNNSNSNNQNVNENDIFNAPPVYRITEVGDNNNNNTNNNSNNNTNNNAIIRRNSSSTLSSQ